MTRQRAPGVTPTPEQPLTTNKPWLLAGVSRSAWYRLLSRGLAPPPVNIPGSRQRWRVSDVIRWVDGLKTSRPRRRRPRVAGAPAAADDGS
jgi:predicted DNA-binding transcriptional regulator AlpA